MKRNWFYSLFVALAFFIFSDALAVSCAPKLPDPDDEEQVDPTPDPDPDPTPDPDPDPTPDPDPAPGDGKIRILAIGNSFSQDAVEQYLWNLFDADHQDVIIGNLYIGGCTLETHFKNSQSGEGKYEYRKVIGGAKTNSSGVSLETGIKDEYWDIITIQQASGSSGIYDTYSPYLPSLLAYIKENARNDAVKLGWHMTWSYAKTSDHSEFSKYDRDQMNMYRMIVSATQNATKDNHFDFVIPSGTAIQNGRTTDLGDTFNRDGYHLEVNYGRYTAACTWFEVISGKSVVGNAFKPSSVNEKQMEIAQNAAHLAVLKPYEVTDMPDFRTPVTEIPALKDAVCIDFGGGSANSPETWNRVADFSINEPVALKDSLGNWPPVKIVAMDGFTESYNGVGSEPDRIFTFGELKLPKSVWADGILLKANKNEGDKGPASVTLSGFETGAAYTIRVIAVRWNGSVAARECEYSVKGAAESEPVRFHPGAGRDFTAENDDYTNFMASFSGVKADADGNIAVSVKAIDTTAACDGLINAVVITKE